ncbi:hypothetical protein pb186bvf_006292 [Paramecium bursaria]
MTGYPTASQCQSTVLLSRMDTLSVSKTIIFLIQLEAFQQNDNKINTFLRKKQRRN